MVHVIDTIGNSLVQHGPRDDMAYLMRLHPADAPLIVENLEQLACTRGYSKVVAKVPVGEARRFVAAGYHLEAALPCFFQQRDAACFMAKYFSSDRKVERQPLLVRDVLAVAGQQQRARFIPLPEGIEIRELLETECEQAAVLFEGAPRAGAPDPGSSLTQLRGGNPFFLGACGEDGLMGVCCASLDPEAGSAEVTHLAAASNCEGKEIELHLLQQVEQKLVDREIQYVFAMTQACSFGNNIAFARNGYQFGGTLTNNTASFGRLLSANVWFKSLAEDPGIAWRSLYQPDTRQDQARKSPFQLGEEQD